MTRKVTALRNKAAKAVTLGPGLHAARIDQRMGQVFLVRTFDGAELSVAIDDAVEPGLVEECLRHGRPVVLADTARGPHIVGALQTTRSIACDASGDLSVAARDIKLTADRALRIECGPVALTADKVGVLRVEGDRMVIDMGALIRLLAARVELP